MILLGLSTFATGVVVGAGGAIALLGLATFVFALADRIAHRRARRIHHWAD